MVGNVSVVQIGILIFGIALTTLYLRHDENLVNWSRETKQRKTTINVQTNSVLDEYEEKLNRAQEAAVSLLNLIHHRYELYSDESPGLLFFLASSNINSVTWEIIKHKYIQKLLTARDKLVSPSQTLSDPEFLMIFGGSSVTAGHDNYFNQSYPSIVERRMRPIFEELGIRLTVRNIAQGI
jgi:hypothetical protein